MIKIPRIKNNKDLKDALICIYEDINNYGLDDKNAIPKDCIHKAIESLEED